MIKIKQPIVFVLGAGFTYSFNESAPLLKVQTSRLNIPRLRKKYERFSNVMRLLKTAIPNDGDGYQINVEEVLSRLYTGMPYDDEFLSEGERKSLLDDLMRNFNKMLKGIKASGKTRPTLDKFARFVVETNSTCITFNYDDMLDKALWEYKKASDFNPKEKYWHPDGGYGFFCRPSETLLGRGENTVMDVNQTLLLKLHGSVNWRIKKGVVKPYPVDTFVHHESWCGNRDITDQEASVHLEADPFMVPPVFDKSVLNEQPVLRTVWSIALKKLYKARTVVFIGCSFPKTDAPSVFLFKEAIRKKSQVRKVVVTRHSTNDSTKLERYSEIFPKIGTSDFYFEGTIKWIEDNCVLPEIKVLEGAEVITGKPQENTEQKT